jgi:hypothetical protein
MGDESRGWRTIQTLLIYPRPTCLFLAFKTENHLIPIDALISRFSKLLAAEVLQLEFLVAQSLQFEFACWHAHKALKGFWLDFQVSFSVFAVETSFPLSPPCLLLDELVATLCWSMTIYLLSFV